MTQSTDALFDEIERFITESRAMLEDDAVMELQGLDEQVRSLCEMVLQLTPEQRAANTARMESLLAGLKSLGEALVESRDRLSGDIRQLSHSKKAARAYKIVDASDDYGRRDDEE